MTEGLNPPSSPFDKGDNPLERMRVIIKEANIVSLVKGRAERDFGRGGEVRRG
jgi:hypothetical protein